MGEKQIYSHFICSVNSNMNDVDIVNPDRSVLKKKKKEGVNVLKYSASMSQISHQVLFQSVLPSMLLWWHLVIFFLSERLTGFQSLTQNHQTLISVSAFWWSSSFCLLSVHFRLWVDLTCEKNKTTTTQLAW